MIHVFVCDRYGNSCYGYDCDKCGLNEKRCRRIAEIRKRIEEPDYLNQAIREMAERTAREYERRI